MNAVMYSVVIPVYRSIESLPSLLHDLDELYLTLTTSLEVVFVIDGSPDNSLLFLLDELPQRSFRSKVVDLSRNFGSFSAIRVGLQETTGDYVSIVSADGQEPLSLTLNFFQLLEQESYDVVLGTRTTRHDPLTTRMFSNAYWWMYRRLINPAVPPRGVDVFGCSRKVVGHLNSLGETNTSLVGLLLWVGFRRAELPYERRIRAHGTSSWSLSKRFRYLFDSVYSFTDLPIILLQLLGLVGLSISLVVGVIVVIMRLMGNITVPGYAPIILSIAASTSALLVGMGILGGYIWRTFENSKSRPVAIVREILSFN